MKETGKETNGILLSRDDHGIRYFMDEHERMRVIMEVPSPELLAVRSRWNFGGGRRSPVVCTFPNGDEMIFWSVICAAQYLNLDIARIVACCQGESSVTKGFKFRYVDVLDETRINGVLEAEIDDSMRSNDIDDENADCVFVLKPKIDEDGNEIKRTVGRPKKSDYKVLYRDKQSVGNALGVIDRALGEIIPNKKMKKVKFKDEVPAESSLDSSSGQDI